MANKCTSTYVAVGQFEIEKLVALFIAASHWAAYKAVSALFHVSYARAPKQAGHAVSTADEDPPHHHRPLPASSSSVFSSPGGPRVHAGCPRWD